MRYGLLPFVRLSNRGKRRRSQRKELELCTTSACGEMAISQEASDDNYELSIVSLHSIAARRRNPSPNVDRFPLYSRPKATPIGRPISNRSLGVDLP